ncbi:MAG TPA: sulfurtransferase TusA family protein [Thermoanaerobaculia bacterium]|nr:sulfurtransferase TusA family protein [Thermoanaerobaculia bacterium]
MPPAIIHQLDVTGTFCPLPILLAAREMLRLTPGDRLEVIGDDPGILEDMPVWCQRAGHRLLDISEQQGKIVSLIEKGAAALGTPGRRRGGAARGAGAASGAGATRGKRRPAKQGS